MLTSEEKLRRIGGKSDMISDLLNNTSPVTQLISAFHWKLTPQGFNYWCVRSQCTYDSFTEEDYSYLRWLLKDSIDEGE